MEDRQCKICYEIENNDNKLINPCKCKGTIKWIHDKCLKEWININKEKGCSICKYEYKTIKTCNYPKLISLSENKNIKIVSIFIMFTLIIIIGWINYLIFNKNEKSKVLLIVNGFRGLTLLSFLVIPFLYYKKWINIENINRELNLYSPLLRTNVGNISSILFIFINDLLKKIIYKYLKFDYQILNYSKT